MDQERFRQDINVSGTAEGLLKPDPSMNQMIDLVESIYGTNLSGRLNIYNLFYLKNPNSSQAVRELNELAQSGNYDLEGNIPSVKELLSHPWILVAWGLEQTAHLKAAKRNWLDQIEEANVPFFGKIHSKYNDYYHICPRLYNDRRPMIDELVSLYGDKMNIHV